MKKEVVLLGLFVILISSFVSASYISGDIYIYEDGRTKFKVNSDTDIEVEGLEFDLVNNKLIGITEMLVSKSAGIWKFELDFGNYKNILLDVYLPKNLESILSIEGNDNIIDFDDETIGIIDSGDLYFQVEYKLKSKIDFSWIYYILIIMLLISVIYLFFKKKGKKRLDFILPIINDNEKKIVELLMKRPLRQKEIRKKLDIPKASFSRYMINLEKKNIIFREGEGKNKIVRLK